MSTPDSGKEIRNGTHTGGGIRKSLLTPCRRIGLPRIRKTANGPTFISPLQTNEPPLKLDSSSAPVNLITKLDEPIITSISQDKSKNLRRKLGQKQDVNCINSDVAVSTVSDNRKKYKNKEENITSENNDNKVKLNGSDHSNTNKNKTEINLKCQLSVKDNCEKLYKNKQENEAAENRGDVSDNHVDCSGSDHSNINKNRTEINFNDKQQLTSKIKKKKQINNADINIITDSRSSDLKDRNSNEFQTEISANEETQIANSQGSDNSDIVVYHSFSRTKRKKCIIDSDEDDGEMFNGFPSSSSSNESLEISRKKRILPNSQDAQKSTFETMEICKTSDIQTNIPVNKNNLIDEVEEMNDSIGNIDNNKTKLKPKYNKSIRRKLSLKKSISDDDSLGEDQVFSSSPKEEENQPDCGSDMDKETLIDEIAKLQKAIENKESQVQRSRQAEIYRNLHKVDDLKSETQMWKLGCQNALRDLLAKLNEHTKIDMNALLHQLKVPQDLFTYDAENDCFVNTF